MFESERNILASILSSPDLINQLIIPDEYFIDPINNFCIKMLKKQYQDHKTIDLSMIGQFYSNHFKTVKFNEFISYMIDLMENQLICKSNFLYYQEAVVHSYKDNQLRLLINKFKNNQITQEDLLSSINELEKIYIKTKSSNLNPEEVLKIILSTERKLDMRFKKLQCFANIQEHDLPIIAARPGIGKTGFMLNLLEDFSSKYKCLYFNLEMTERELLSRLISINSKIGMRCFTDIKTDYQRNKIKESVYNVSQKKIKIVTGSQSIKSIRSQIIRESQEEHLICFIDYVGLIRGTERSQNSYERVTSIVKELRQISLDYNCTIFVAAQINRNSEREKDKLPKISELKESGELEQSGTTVMMLHNEMPNLVSEEPIPVKLIIGKNRNGPTGIVNMFYDKTNQRFDEKKDKY